MHPIDVTLYIGTIALLPGRGRSTGMFKHAVDMPIELGREGFIGDQQADRTVHGGPEKAVHLYPAEHYAQLATRFPDAAAALVPGSLGENISCTGFTEADICLGDVFQLGTARLQLSQPRNPCWKIDARFGCDGMAAFIAESGLAGWYWRVLQPGRVAPGDCLRHVDRPPATMSLARAQAIWRIHRPPLADLECLAASPALAPAWRQKIVDRVQWLRRQTVTAPPPLPET